VVRATDSGFALGVIAGFLPLTLASGKAQLGVAITNAETLGTALLVAAVAGKILAVAISLTTGFIGGPVVPALFIGGTAGLAIPGIFPDIPIAHAFSCMLAAIVSRDRERGHQHSALCSRGPKRFSDTRESLGGQGILWRYDHPPRLAAPCSSAAAGSCARCGPH
jgi:hypothetical protein